MKISSAAITVAAISLLSTSHAAPLEFKNGAITGRLHYRRGSDLSDVSDISSLTNTKLVDDLDMAFEPENRATLLPRILNFFKRQTSSSATLAAPDSNTADTSTGAVTPGTQDTDATTTLMTPDLESYGFSTTMTPGSALVPVKEVKE